MRRLFQTIVVCLFLALAISGCSSSGGGSDDSAQTLPGADKTSGSSDDRYSSDDDVSAPENPGWFRGDLHAHSKYSDGDVSVGDVVRIAEEKDLDFFVVTEHMHGENDNVTKSWNDIGYRSNKLTLLYGAEWTTGKGHANVWSNRQFDWKALYAFDKLEDAKSAIELAHTFRSEGQEVLFSINHPISSWEYSLEDSLGADSMEIWNSVIPMASFYDSYLKQGKRISAIGSSDSHDHMAEYKEIKDLAANVHNIGWPTTWVYARSNSAIDILKAIKAGHTAVSISPDGPFMEFTADADNDGVFELMQGDTIPDEALGKDVRFKVMVTSKDKKAYILIVVKNGMMILPTLCINDVFFYEFTDKPEAGDYYRVQLQIGIIPVAFTGPIYTW